MQALVDVTAQVVPGARWVSVTRGLDDRFTTMASTDPVATQADLLQYTLGTGPCIDAVIDAAVFSSNDLALDDTWSSFGPLAARQFHTRSVLSIRLTMEDTDNLNAGLNLYGDHIDAFDERSRYLAMLMATHASVAVAAVVNRELAQNMKQALDSNRRIGIAIGVLMTTHKITDEQAFGLLRIASQNRNRKLRDIAADVVDTGRLD